MIEFARRAVPALLAILYLGSSMTPCSSVTPSSERVASHVAAVAVEASREVRSYAHHLGAVANVDTLSAPQ